MVETYLLLAQEVLYHKRSTLRVNEEANRGKEEWEAIPDDLAVLVVLRSGFRSVELDVEKHGGEDYTSGRLGDLSDECAARAEANSHQPKRTDCIQKAGEDYADCLDIKSA